MRLSKVWVGIYGATIEFFRFTVPPLHSPQDAHEVTGICFGGAFREHPLKCRFRCQQFILVQQIQRMI